MTRRFIDHNRLMPAANSYQLKKAKQIVSTLLTCQGQSTLSRRQLAQVVAMMSNEEWRTVTMTAGVPVADLDAKAAVLALLRGKTIHAVR